MTASGLGTAERMPPPDPLNHMRAGGVATTLKQVAKGLLDTQVAGFQGEVPGWIGEAADAYTESIRTLGVRVREISASIGVCASHLAEWSEAVGEVTVKVVPDLHDQYEEAQEVYRRRVELLTEELLHPEHPITQSEYDSSVDKFADERLEAQNKVLEQYKKVMSDLDDLAARVATAMQAVLDQEIGVENWTKEGGSRTDLATRLFDDIPVVDGQAEYELAQQLAKEAADYFSFRGLDPQQVIEFYDRYKEHLDNPFFAEALNEFVTPEQMLQFINDADHMRFVVGLKDRYHEVFESLVAGLGYSFVISAGGFDAGCDPSVWEAYQAARDGLRTDGGLSHEEFLGQQTELWKKAAGEKLVFDQEKLEEPYSTGRHFVPHRGYEYLGLMMGAVGERFPGCAFGSDFFRVGADGTSLAQDIVRFEKRYRIDGGMESGSYGTGIDDGVLGGGSFPFGSVECMLSLFDEPVVPTVGSYGVPRTWQGFGEADSARYDAVQKFLLEEVPDELKAGEGDENPMTMTQYLSGNRWEKGFHPFDEGHALGKLLTEMSDPSGKHVAVETVEHPEDWASSRERRAAMVAAEFMEGYQDGLEKSGVNQWTGRHDFGDANKALRNWAGQILAPYISDMGESVSVNVDSDVEGEGVDVDFGLLRQRARLVVSADFLERLRGEDGFFKDLAIDDRVDVNKTPDDPTDDVRPYSNPPASEVLMNAALRGFDEDLKWAFRTPVRDAPEVEEGIWWFDDGSGLPESRQPMVQKVINNSASVLALMGASDGEAGVSVGEAEDAMARRSKAIAQFFLNETKVSGFLGLDGRAGSWTDKAYHAVEADLLDQIFSEKSAAKARVERAEQNDSIEQAMKQILFSNYYEGGKLTGCPGQPGEILPAFMKYLESNDLSHSEGSLPKSWWDLPPEVRKQYALYISQTGLSDPAYSQLLIEVDDRLNGGAAEYFEEFDERREK